MFQPTRASHVRRLAFATKLFPRTKSALGLDLKQLARQDQFDGDSFANGRSKNKDLLTFFGLLKDLGSGNTSLVQLPMFRRSIRKLEALVELELELAGAQQILLPLLVPESLWRRSGRLQRHQAALNGVYRLTDPADQQLILGPTFEESVTQLLASLESVTEAQLPILVYQTSRKYRYEPNPRFGLIRTNEFLMNDLYSFDANLQTAHHTYHNITQAYQAIFKRLGLDCIETRAQMGDIGGKHSHEYHLVVQSGEDTIIKCNNCHQATNVELHQQVLLPANNNSSVATPQSGLRGHPAPSNGDDGHQLAGGDTDTQSTRVCPSCGQPSLEKLHSLELGHAFLLSDTYSKPLKARYTSSANERLPFEMGCYGLGLTRILGAGIDLLSILPNSLPSSAANSTPDNHHQQQEQQQQKPQLDDQLLQLRWPNQVEPYTLGIVAPARRSNQYNAGSSDFIKNLVERILGSTTSVDIIVEDRDKEGIRQRLLRLQSLGIPNILVVGQKFLEETPQVELLKLDPDKRRYSQSWFTSDQICDYVKRLDDKLVEVR